MIYILLVLNINSLYSTTIIGVKLNYYITHKILIIYLTSKTFR